MLFGKKRHRQYANKPLKKIKWLSSDMIDIHASPYVIQEHATGSKMRQLKWSFSVNECDVNELVYKSIVECTVVLEGTAPLKIDICPCIYLY